MPPKNAPSQPAALSRTVLAQPRVQVEQQIGERIRQGAEMQERPKQNLDDLVKYVTDIQKWRSFNLDLLTNSFTDETTRNEYYRSARESFVDTCPSVISVIGIAGVSASVDKQILTLESILERLAFYEEPTARARPTEAKDRSKIFVVHGHDEGALQAMARSLETVGLQAIVLREQPDQGYTTIEKFEARASEVGFAVALLTPDDLGGPLAASEQAARARQNVIFELGYFVGSLGRGRACLLRKGDVEIPSDLFGVIYTDFDHPAEGWKVKLARELKAAGFKFDADKVLA
jgi:predicted nucleotide-binding protein